MRPPFKKIAADLKQLRVIAGSRIENDSPFPRHNELFPDNEHVSPNLAPVSLPGATSAYSFLLVEHFSIDSSI